MKTTLLKTAKVLLAFPLLLFVLLVAAALHTQVLLKNFCTDVAELFDELIEVLREWWDER